MSNGVIRQICNFFGVEPDVQRITVSDGVNNYSALMSICDNDLATRNRDVILVRNTSFIVKTFGVDAFSFMAPNGGVPRGHSQEEFFLCVPLPGRNNSYDSWYLDEMYDIVEPKLKRAFSQYPIFFDNIDSKVCLCMMFNSQVFMDNCINSSAMREVFSIVKRIINYFKTMRGL